MRILAGDRHPERCQSHMGRQQTPIQTAQGGDRTRQSIWCAEYTSPKLDALPRTPPLRHPRQARRRVNGRRTSVGNARDGRDCMKRRNGQYPVARCKALYEGSTQVYGNDPLGLQKIVAERVGYRDRRAVYGACGLSTPPRKHQRTADATRARKKKPAYGSAGCGRTMLPCRRGSGGSGSCENRYLTCRPERSGGLATARDRIAVSVRGLHRAGFCPRGAQRSANGADDCRASIRRTRTARPTQASPNGIPPSSRP